MKGGPGKAPRRTISARPAGRSRTGSQAALVEIPLASRPFELLAGDVTERAWKQLQAAREKTSAAVDGRTIWSINSTGTGGGVAEMQRTLLPYWRGDGLDARWLVLSASQSFFRLTKRLHNMLHGAGPERPLGLRALRLYEQASRTAASAAAVHIAPGDVVILHDPQTAGLIPHFKRRGAIVIWRCHIGADLPTASAARAWTFLLPYVALADLAAFTRTELVPAGLDPAHVRIIAPAIDPRSPKNQPLESEVADAILHHCGIATRPGHRSTSTLAARTVNLAWGGHLLVHRRCGILRQDRRTRLGEDQLIVSLSRWDRLKDPVGIMGAFAGHVADPAARLVLAGPPTAAVTDDPEGAAVLREVRATWRALPLEARRRIDVAVLPMVDLEENGLIVNALQRQASVVVKKSVQEGFGLGVTEALWKTKPVVATNVGGHSVQIEQRQSGLLVDDPADVAAFGAAITNLLKDPVQALSLAAAGHQRARDNFLADRHYSDWSSILGDALASDSPTASPRRAAGSRTRGALAAKGEGQMQASSLDHGESSLATLARQAGQRAAAARRRAAASDKRAQEHQLAGADRAAAVEHRAAQLHRQAARSHEHSARHFEEMMRAAPNSSV